jgi:hypothetical protein
MKKSTSILLSVCLFLIVTVSVQHFRVVKASVDVPSIINSDTIWTQSNSPYELKGPVLINEGVTLTIEPGTTVNLNDYYMQVNGTLNARGTKSNLINLNSGTIVFKDSSTDWYEQTSSGCIIENANLISSSIDIENSPKINNNVIREIYVDGSGIITENIISGQVRVGGSPKIINNNITNGAPFGVSITGGGSPLIIQNTINCRILVSSGFPTIADNTINDGIHVDSSGGNVVISGNNITTRGDYPVILVQGVSASILNNNISGKQGIYITNPNNFLISDNKISNCPTAITASNTGNLVIQRNLICNNSDGLSLTISPSVFYYFENYTLTIQNNFIIDNLNIAIKLNHPFPTIINNTVANNKIGIIISEASIYSQQPVILYNNIYGNEINLKSETEVSINATFNWWGITDIGLINQTIYDLKYDFNLGTINFVPVLTEENPEIPEFPSWTILTIRFFVGITVAMVLSHNLKKHNKGSALACLGNG